jgi:hypothetical protein
MSDKVYGVVVDHPWPRKSHHAPDLRSHIHFIAVDLAVCTGRLFLPKATFFRPFLCILEKLPAIRAEFALPVIMTAMDTDHTPDGFNLSFSAVHLNHRAIKYEKIPPCPL